MKKLLFLVFILTSLTSFGQFLNYTNINGRYKWIAGKFDSTFTIPVGTSPSLRTGGGNAPGALFYSTTDSTVYQYTGTQWTRLRGSDTAHVISAYVRNTTASPMTPGQVVYINGSTGTTPTIALANNKQDSTSAMTFGFVRGNIPINGFGYITTFGPLEGVNTNAYTEGEVIYLDSIPGQFTHDKPQAPYHMVTLGYIIKKSGGNGTIYAKIQNGYELDELHNVRITEPVLNKSVIIYDSVKGYWVDTTVSAAGLGLGGSGTTNYVSKWTGTSALGNSQIFDNGTSVGIGTASPSALLEVSGTSATTIQVKVKNASNGTLADTRLVVINDANNEGGFFLGSSTRSLDANGVLVYANKQLKFMTNNTVSSGGTDPIIFQAGGNAASQEAMRITGNKRVLINTTTESTWTLDLVGNFRSTLDANINGLTVGKGGGNILTNTAVGYEAILNSTTGAINNTAQGYQALRTNTTGNNNTALGYVSLYTNSVGIRNTAVGSFALQGLNSDNNTGVGFQNLLDVTSGQGNTALGSNTGRGITTGSYNTIIGASVTGLSSSLSNTIILADGQGNRMFNVSSAIGVNIGTNAGISYTTGSGVAIGPDAGRRQTTASENTIIGSNAGAYLTTNNQNTIVGFFAGNIVTGSGNTYLGWYAGVSAGASNYNTGIGTGALQGITTGSNNTSLGYRAGRFFGASTSSNTTGANGIFIGYQSRASADGNTNETVIGYDVVGNGSNSVTLGNSSVTKTVLQSGVLVGTTTSAGYALDVNGTLRGTGVFSLTGAGQRHLISGGFQVPYFYVPASQGQIAINNSADTQNIWIVDNSGNVYNRGTLGVGVLTPNASAVLDVTSTTKGFLPPRMTNAQMVAITTPAAGLVVYDTTNNKLNVYDGTNWVTLH